MSKKTILIVDDEEHILELLSYNLDNNGFAVIQADTGEKALEILEKQTVNLVLLDIMLPGMDGIAILKSIRSNTKIKRMPIILLTAKNDEIDTVLGLEMGADDYISKPFGIHEVIARIKAVLRRIEENTKNDDTQLEQDIVVIGDLKINRSMHTLSLIHI